MYIGLHEKKSGNALHHWEKNMRITRVPLFSDETIKQIQTISKTFQVQECICSIIT